MLNFESNILINEIQKNYDIGKIVELKQLSDSINTHYTIETDKQKYALRVYKPNFYTNLDLHHLELNFLDFMRVNKVPVSFPIQKIDGNDLHTLKFEGKTIYLALFSYAKGDSVGPPSINQAFQYGKDLARLHSAGKSFPLKNQLPDRGARYLSDYQKKILRTVTPTERLTLYFTQALQQFDKLLSSDETKKLQQGVIWGDSHFGNCNFDENDNLTFYDFDTLGSGFFLFDIVTGLCSILNHKPSNFTELKSSVIKGYESILQLTKTEKESINLFIKIRCLENLGFEIEYRRNYNIGIDNSFFKKYEDYIFDRIEAYK